MHIVEGEPHRIGAHRVDSDDGALPFSANGDPVFPPVALNLSAWAHHTQIFRAEIIACAIPETDLQDAAVVRQPDLIRPPVVWIFAHRLALTLTSPYEFMLPGVPPPLTKSTHCKEREGIAF